MPPMTLDFLIHLVAMNLGLAFGGEVLLKVGVMLDVIAEDSKVDLKNCGVWQHQQSPETVSHPSLLYGASRTYIQELRVLTSLCRCGVAPGGKSE